MKMKFLVLGFVTGAIGLGGCGIVHDYNEYELESPSDTTEIRHYKNICVNQRNGAACYYVYENGTYLSDEMRDKYLQAGCSLGYQKACDSVRSSFISSSCNLNNDVSDCSDKVNIFWEQSSVDNDLKYSNERKDLTKYYGIFYEGLKFAKKGCELGSEKLCLEQGNFARELSLDYLDSQEYSNTTFYNKEAIQVKRAGFGKYSQDDISKIAFNSYKQLCNKNNLTACVELGDFIERHLGNDPYKLSDTVLEDVKKYYLKACKTDPFNGCEKLGDAYLHNGNKKLAKYYYEMALNSSSEVVRSNVRLNLLRLK
ncbi:hypothetical protein [Succinivibrio dextrinosolvens]|uniref:hypothetical protein n=1 Tax=Succinivibrio dextrinosolvens TaxID=83771 RepID=UPI00241F5185|nr:hypothetical protein [Succinivibrio dextrinosolvens]MBE6422921.1 sel1 repeat family protein [Succinivibrio dextrinosolvens]